MHFGSLIAGAALVAATNALLLPPDIDDSVTTLPVPIKVDADVAISNAPQSRDIELECPGCLRFGRRHRKEIPSHLKLHFAVESAHGADRLTLNGYELYPNPVPARDALTAPVIPEMGARRGGRPHRFRGGPGRAWKDQPLGFAMQTGAVAIDDDDDLQLISVELQIIEVGSVFIERIPNVQVQLVKTPSGKLAIGSVETIGSQGDGKKKECTTTLCKWKALFFEKLSRLFKSCGGSQGPPPSPQQHGEHRHGQGHGHHMGHRHGWGHGLRVFVTHILFPILIGIVAGISASIIGMIFGTFVVFLWRTLVRRRGSRSSHRCRYAHKAATQESAVDEEKSGLLDAQEEAEAEAPPAYVPPVAEEQKPENDA